MRAEVCQAHGDSLWVQGFVPPTCVGLGCKANILTGSSVIVELLGKPRWSSVFLIRRPAFSKMFRNVVSCLQFLFISIYFKAPHYVVIRWGVALTL